MKILSIKDLSYSYMDSKTNILNKVNMDFELGKFYAIVGKSGAGKTTFLSLLAGLDSPKKGKILVNGEDITKRGYSYHRKNNISLVFQNYNLIDYLTSYENIKLVNKNAKKDIFYELDLEEDIINRNVMKLSGGQQQRVAIARALASKAPIILCDEPTGNLDENTAKEIIIKLKKLAKERNKCVIVVTHSNYVSDEADEVLEIKNRNFVKIK